MIYPEIEQGRSGKWYATITFEEYTLSSKAYASRWGARRWATKQARKLAQEKANYLQYIAELRQQMESNQ